MRHTKNIKSKNRLRLLGLFILALTLSVVEAVPVSANTMANGTLLLQQKSRKSRGKTRTKSSTKSRERATATKRAKVNDRSNKGNSRAKNRSATRTRNVEKSNSRSKARSNRNQSVNKSRSSSRAQTRVKRNDNKVKSNRARIQQKTRTTNRPKERGTSTRSATRTRSTTKTVVRNRNSGSVNNGNGRSRGRTSNNDDDRSGRNNGRVDRERRSSRGNNGRVDRDDRNNRRNNGRVQGDRNNRRNWSRIERNTRRTRLDGYGRNGRVHKDLGRRYRNKRGGWGFSVWFNNRARQHFGNRNYYRYHPYYGRRYNRNDYYRRNYYRNGRAALGFYINIPFYRSHYRNGYTRRFIYRQRFKSNSHYNGRSYGVDLNIHTQLKKKVRNISGDRVKIEFEIERISLYDGNDFLGDVDRIPGNLDEIEAIVHPDGYVEFDKMVHLIGDLNVGFELISTRHYSGSLLSSYESGHRMDVGELDLYEGKVHKVRNSRLFNPNDNYNGLVPISLMPDDEQYGFQYLAGGHDYDDDYNSGNYDYYKNDQYDDQGYSHRNSPSLNTSIKPRVGLRGMFNNKAVTSYETENGIKVDEDRQVEIEMLDPEIEYKK